MSRITWEIEERETYDPWAGGTQTQTVRTGWACECGQVPPTRLRSWTLEDHAARHLIEHGAPTMTSEPCICGWVYTFIAYEDAGSIRRRHEIHHHRWLLEVWDAPITEPGLYDLAPADYHRDPVPGGSLSQSRAKTLLREAGPARFRYYEATPETKPEWDLGTAAHAIVLGKGSERLTLIDAKDYKTKAAQDARRDAYAKGMTPVLPHQMRQAEDMADALSRHTLATETLAGQHEVAAFYRRDDGLWLRSQFDAMNDACTGDYKTTVDASSWFARSAWRFRYYMQGAWYRRMRAWLTGDWLPYRLVAQEVTAPYLVSVWELDDLAIRQGESDMDEAIRIYQQCMESGQWPGYPDEIQTLSPPDWALDDEIEID